MSVIQTVKEKMGLEDQRPKYQCDACGAEFHSTAEPGSYWFECEECESSEATRVA